MLGGWHSDRLGSRPELALWQRRCTTGLCGHASLRSTDGIWWTVKEGVSPGSSLRTLTWGSAVSQGEIQEALQDFMEKRIRSVGAVTKSLQGPCKFSGQEMLSRNCTILRPEKG